jgi:hypothetical protein
VTGWRKPDGSSDTYLFFQDREDELQYVRCDKSLGTTDKESTCWAEPVKLNSNAIPGSRLAASTILWDTLFQVSFTSLVHRSPVLTRPTPRSSPW